MTFTEKEAILMKKVREFEAHIQKVSSFWRMAFHSKSTRRIYLSERDCQEYPLGQNFKVVKVSSKQDILDMIRYNYFDSLDLPVLICFPEMSHFDVLSHQSKKDISK